MTHFISFISTANELRPSMGASAEKVRSMKASVYGTIAFSTGAYKPQAESRATEQRLRMILLLPAMFGPATSVPDQFWIQCTFMKTRAEYSLPVPLKVHICSYGPRWVLIDCIVRRWITRKQHRLGKQKW
jgi:hypothetical protein